MNNVDVDGMMFNLSGKVDSYALEDLLTCAPPDQEPTSEGGMAWGPQAQGYFDALFHRFGLTMSSTDPRFADTKYVVDLWYRCVGTFGTFIEAADLWPAIFERRLAEWEPGFADYLRAVMADDREKASELAAKLNIEKLNAKMPRHLTGSE